MRQTEVTMVTEGELDECILQVFEDQEEIFYFPITSQNTARSFVKALHTKGLPYESVYKEIGEFEHNFSAWRKGLGRIGIGNRIIERINKPLEDVLLSDDEDDLQEILARLKEKERRPSNDRVPPISKPVDDSRLQRIKDNIQRQTGTNGEAKPKAEQQKDSWRDRIDARVKAAELKVKDTDSHLKVKDAGDSKPRVKDTSDSKVKASDSKVKDTEFKVPDSKIRAPESMVKIAVEERSSSVPNSPSLSRTGSGRIRGSESPSLSRTGSGRIRGSESPSLSRTGSGRIPGAEFEQKEPGVVDFRSILKRRNNDDNSSPGDRRSMPPSFENEKNKWALSGSADRINKLGNGEQIGWLDESKERSRNRGESEPRGTTHQDTKTDTSQTVINKTMINTETEVLAKTTERVTEKTKPSVVVTEKITETVTRKVSERESAKNDKPSATETLDQRGENGESDDSDSVDYNEEPLPPTAGRDNMAAPLAGVESDSMPESDTSSVEMISANESPEVESEPDQPNDEPQDPLNQENIQGITEVTKVTEIIQDTDELPQIEIDKLNETNDTEESDEEEIDENYDSEWDEENEDLTTEGKNISAHIVKYKADQAEHDTPGYIYVFTDSPQNSPAPRIKVGASRFPHKRLEQALCFNINIRMVASYRVSLRGRVIEKISGKMAIYELEGQNGWYQGPLEDMLQVIDGTAQRYPVNTSDC